jgi:hypothetical protein
MVRLLFAEIYSPRGRKSPGDNFMPIVPNGNLADSYLRQTEIFMIEKRFADKESFTNNFGVSKGDK